MLKSQFICYTKRITLTTCRLVVYFVFNDCQVGFLYTRSIYFGKVLHKRRRGSDRAGVAASYWGCERCGNTFTRENTYYIPYFFSYVKFFIYYFYEPILIQSNSSIELTPASTITIRRNRIIGIQIILFFSNDMIEALIPCSTA